MPNMMLSEKIKKVLGDWGIVNDAIVEAIMKELSEHFKLEKLELENGEGLKIISDNTIFGTKVFLKDIELSEEISITGIRWSLYATDGIGHVWLELI